MKPPLLTAPGLALTELRETDIDRITAYCQDPVFERFLSTPWPYERAHAEAFVREFAPDGWERGAEATWAIRERPDGELLGVIGLRIPSGSLGFWLGAPHRGRGLMSAAVEAVADAAFSSDGLGLERLTWECVIGNTASAALARSVGFRYDGVGPGTVPGRDGEPPLSWLGSMSPADRGVRHEWPIL